MFRMRARMPADQRGAWLAVDGGGWCFRMRAKMPADRRGAWLAVDSGGRCFRVRARMPADRRGAWLPLMVVVGVQDAGKDAGGPAWHLAGR